MRRVPLGEVATVERRSVDPQALPADTPYLGLEHIEPEGRIVGYDTAGGAGLKSTKFLFTPEHVLLGKLRPNLGKIGRPDRAGVCSTDIFPIRPGKHLDRGYLAHYLAQPRVVAYAASRATGANLPRLSVAAVAGFTIPLPSLREQRRIAAILDHADALRAKRRQVLAHLDSLTQAIFHDMFSDHDFEPVALGALIDSQQIGLDRRAADQGRERAYEYVKMDAITSDGMFQASNLTRVDASAEEVARYSLAAGDLILNTRNSRELVGKSAIYRGPARLYNNNIMRIRFDERILADYVHAYLWSAKGRQQLNFIKSGTTGVHAIYAKSLATVMIPVPPMNAQLKFVRSLAGVHSQRTDVGARQALDDELFASLQSRAFRGEL